jgi:hypothetical protein
MEEEKKVKVQIPLKEICGSFRDGEKWVVVPKGGAYAMWYDFDLLEKDLIADGQTKPINVTRLRVTLDIKNNVLGRYKKIHPDYKYRVHDGNHRCYVLNKLYGGDHLVDAYIRTYDGYK